MFMQNGEYTAFWYLQLFCYLTQLHFTIGQKDFVEFFGIFRDNCRIWKNTNVYLSLIAYKSVPLRNIATPREKS